MIFARRSAGQIREGAVTGAEEQQRVSIGIHDRKIPHPPDGDGVVAGIVFRFEITIDISQRAIENRASRSRRVATPVRQTCPLRSGQNSRRRSRWPALSTFMQKLPESRSFGQLELCFPGNKATNGGSRDSEEKD